MVQPKSALHTMMASAVLFVVGCGQQPGSETTMAEATVKGVVKLDGKPATEGEIIFDAGNYQRQVPQSKVPIGKDGTYEVKTVAGQNQVSLGGTLARKYPILQHKRKSFNAVAGANTFDFESESK